MSARKYSEQILDWERCRQEKPREAIGELDLPDEEKETFQTFLTHHHRAFCLEHGERGETDLICMEIDTGGDAHLRKQRVQRLPLALRQIVAQQLKDMQEQGALQPSKSPWASPVVLVKKRDGTHRFCVDYQIRHKTRQVSAAKNLGSTRCPEASQVLLVHRRCLWVLANQNAPQLPGENSIRDAPRTLRISSNAFWPD